MFSNLEAYLIFFSVQTETSYTLLHVACGRGNDPLPFLIVKWSLSALFVASGIGVYIKLSYLQIKLLNLIQVR